MTPTPADVQHDLRVRRLLRLASGGTAVVAGLWALLQATRGAWAGVAIQSVVVALALLAYALQRRGHTRASVWLMFFDLFAILCFSAACVDVPTPGVPRVVHHLLLALGVSSCLGLRHERLLLRVSVPLACGLAFGWFACADPAWSTWPRSPWALPDAVRAVGLWPSEALALASLYAVVYVLQADVAERHTQADELRDAMLRGELALHYQPQVDAAGRVVGAEALVRWLHPQRGMVSPGEFIPLAERTGLMVPLGGWVLRTACTRLATWARDPRMADLQLAVNVSASQFAHPGFEDEVRSTLTRTGAEPTRLKLELTESVLAHDLESVAARMTRLRALGIGLSLDDFGTGFSSLNYLRRLPLDQLKIDQSFVRQMQRSEEDAAIVRMVIALGDSLHLQVIAEGVETPAEREALAALGCGLYQGFLYSKALPVVAFERWVGAGGAVPPDPAAEPPAAAVHTQVGILPALP